MRGFKPSIAFGSVSKRVEREPERWWWYASSGGEVRGSSRKKVPLEPERSEERPVNGAPPPPVPVPSFRMQPAPTSIGPEGAIHVGLDAAAASAAASAASTSAGSTAGGWGGVGGGDGGGGGVRATASASWDDGGSPVPGSGRAAAVQKHRVAAERNAVAPSSSDANTNEPLPPGM